MDDQQRRLAEELLFTGKEKPSFAKRLYFGQFVPEGIFPFPEPTPEEKDQADKFLTELKDFADKNIDGAWIDRHAEIPQSVISGLGKLGLLGMTIPKEYNGLGMSQYSYCRAMECVARYCSATALFGNAHQSIGLKALLLFGTDKQKEHWLPILARGENLAAFALTEPNAGSDASAIETRAVYDPSKNVYRINGKKQWITNGGIAKILTVMARTEIDTPNGKQDKITAFLVTPDMPGFKVTAASLEKVGMRGSKTSNLQFENLEVPAENILGPIGGGLRVCLTVLDYGRTTFGATCTGAAKFLKEKAIYHATHRRQFKQPLAAFPRIKKKLATIAALAYAMEASTYLTAGLVDSGASDFMLESAILKVFTSESLWTIIYETMQIYGGRSFFTDEPLERMMRDGRLNMIGEGANEVLRAFIGVVGMRDVGVQLKGIVDALKDPLENYPLFKEFGKHFWERIQLPKIPINSYHLEAEGKELASAIRRFGFAIVRLLQQYREDVLEKELALDRIATSAIAIYTTTAVLSKLDSDLARVGNNVKALGNDVPVGKLYCRLAMRELDKALGTLFKNNEDKDIEKVSDLLCGIPLRD